MSIALMRAVALHARLRGEMRRTLLAVACHADEQGVCTANLSVIARTASRHKCLVLSDLHGLENARCLTLPPQDLTGPHAGIRIHLFFREPADGPVSRAALAGSWRLPTAAR